MIGCCQNTDTLNVCFFSCDEGITLPMLTTDSGTWQLHFEFAGTMRRYKFTAVSGQPLIIPNKFNESYNHLLKLVKPNGSLFNNTCYWLQTMPAYCEAGTFSGSDAEESGSVISGTLTFVAKTTPDPENELEVPTGYILQSDLLIGKTPWDFIIIGNTVLQWQSAGITYDIETGSFDFTAYNENVNDTIITIPYNETV